MQHVGADEHIGARPDREAAQFVRLERAPREQPARRIQPQRLLQHLVGEAQATRRHRGCSALPAEARSASASSSAAASGCWLTRYQVQVSAAAVVSCPATIRVSTSSINLLVAHRRVGFAVACAPSTWPGSRSAPRTRVRRRSISSATRRVSERNRNANFRSRFVFLGHDLERVGAQLLLEARKILAENRPQHDLAASVRWCRR